MLKELTESYNEKTFKIKVLIEEYMYCYRKMKYEQT